MSQTKQSPQINDFLSAPLTVGEPDVVGALAVFPLFGPEPSLAYAGFAQARESGASIKELESGASVRELTIHNPTDQAVLLYEGEEVLGAQQNRTFDLTVLVAAGETLKVPVSCVEAGRWDGSRHRESFAASPRAAYPHLRRRKQELRMLSAERGGPAVPDQSQVWDEVAAKSERFGAASPTAAMGDIYEQRASQLAAMTDGMELRPGQLGAIAAIGGELAVIDHVSRTDVFAALHGALVQGYALDALEASESDAETPSLEAANRFTLLATDCEAQTLNSPLGLGEQTRLAGGNAVTGSALVHDGELVQLMAFPAGQDGADEGSGRSIRGGRMRRPSRRGS